MEITAFARTSLMITAAMCLLAVFVAWYTVRDRVKLSQIILGLFCYVLVMLLQNVLETLGYSMGLDGPVYGV